uniref:Uncharacterized protein n=1 Tax=Eutreptiella gymnastica TaxID=73025 RepID=A0A7S1JAB1_9EUGL
MTNPRMILAPDPDLGVHPHGQGSQWSKVCQAFRRAAACVLQCGPQPQPHTTIELRAENENLKFQIEQLSNENAKLRDRVQEEEHIVNMLLGALGASVDCSLQLPPAELYN